MVATTAADNRASQAVMVKLGMRMAQNPLPDPPWPEVIGVLEQRAK